LRETGLTRDNGRQINTRPFVVATTGSQVARRAYRLAVIDVVRGVALLAMIVYHFSWDLSANRLIAVDVSTDPIWRLSARLIAGTFLGLVGANLVLAARNGFRPLPYLRRLVLIAVAAGVVSLGTYWFEPDTFVYFGILHCIAVASVLALPFIWAPSWLSAVVAVVFLAGPHFLTSTFFDVPDLYWLGLSTNPPPTVDYVPIFPWLGIVLLGVVAGRFILETGAWPLWQWTADGRGWRILIIAGRWSLPIYLVHQPILVGILFLITPLLGPSHAALAAQLVDEYNASCAVAGYDEAVCSAYSQCILTALSEDEGILLAASRHELSQAQLDLWQAAIAECRTKTLPATGAGGI
jgi:uncharacterized membrane protein